MLILVLLTSLVIIAVLALVHSRLRQFPQLPGPREWPLVGSALEFINRSPVDIFQLLRKYAKEYGTAYKFCFAYDYTLIFAKPEIVEKIVNTQLFASKSQDYDKVAEWIGYGLLISKGEKWFRRRKILTPAFHFKVLESFVRVFNEQSNVLCRKLASFDNSEVDIFPLLKMFTLDVVCESALGYKCHALTESSFYPTAVEEMMSILYWRMFNLFANVDLLFRFTKQYKRFQQLVHDTHQFTLQIINERRQLFQQTGAEKNSNVDENYGRKKFALLDILLQSTAYGKPLSDEDIREEVETFMFAGHDTTASALTFLLFNIAKHPAEQQKLFQEIDDVVGLHSGEISLHTLNDLHYLDLVIKESLRLFPPVPMIARLSTVDTQIEDVKIPVGTCVCVDIFEMHHNPEYFDDAERFNPDRFHAVRETGKSNPFTYIPFSAGSRNCIGQKFAQYELKTATVKILQKFRLELPCPDMEPILKAEIVLKPAKRLPIRFITRF
ncbi:cytochrome P450 4d2-like [Toxorhynchites rutilus septentrionalis]|uniref:cytochrome P450 4d2-like n=1 Tax=Toxorhynchites rutilus septentrionalis TaxID=329112 RepID=UPI0024795B3A|nr:cytochrome P450 4d2-like [Toxorhynchites rutilus septentrionalis]XP_055635296.1 cytochrome P450 4d2-like [Toxorhynchites rutilus septentrionalis]